jgi:Baseplate J-like protein
MNLKLKAFSQLIEDMSAALQSSAADLIDVSVGSVVRAIFEANASVVLWLQWLILRVLQTTRAATSTGVDLDSWMLDFGLERLPAIPSSGVVTFTRFASNLPAMIPVGTTIKTIDGSLSFSVSEDSTLSIWQSASLGYLLPIGVTSVDLPVTSRSGGSVGNVQAGAIAVMATPLPGVDLVINSNPLLNGSDAESDQSFRNRFQGYLATRSRATIAALRSAIASVRQGLNIDVLENTDVDGTLRPGFFVVIVDDGSGYPSSALLSSVAGAVDLIRPVGTMFAILSPEVISVDVSLTAILMPDGNHIECVSNIQDRVSGYLGNLAIGKSAAITRVALSAYNADPGIENITGVLLNGIPTDLIPPPRGVIKAGRILVTINDG